MKKINFLMSSILALIILSGCDRPVAKGMMRPPEGPTDITVVKVRTGNFPMEVSTNGKIEALNTVQIYSRISGFLGERKYREGARVEKGSVLFEIDKSDLENATAVAKASYDLAVANHKNASQILERAKTLIKTNSISKQDYDLAITSVSTTKAVMDSSLANWKQAKLNTSYTIITAPVTGFVDQAKVDQGTFVSAGQNSWLTTMYQTDKVYVNFALSENQKQQIESDYKQGRLRADNNGKLQIALITSDGEKMIRKGVIDFVAPSVDQTSGSVIYRAVLDNNDNLLMSGQFVQVFIEGLEWRDAKYVPKNTVLSNDKGKFVYVLEENNIVVQKQVVVGAWVGDSVIIESGLNGSEKIADSGLAKLKPFSEVIVKGK